MRAIKACYRSGAPRSNHNAVAPREGPDLKTLRILALEPYLARSHEQFLEGLSHHSKHNFELWTLPARKWKWRMRTSALHFAERFQSTASAFDVILASDYVNLAELRALLPPEHATTATVLYFHENQLTYPLQDGEFRDCQFAITHLYGMLVASRVVFNSEFHRGELLTALRQLLKKVPDMKLGGWIDTIETRSEVLPLGIDYARPSRHGVPECPIIAWNHRWEYDKNPRPFLDALVELDRRNLPFAVRLLGQRFRTIPEEFQTLLDRLAHRIVSSDFPEQYTDYLEVLAGCDIAVSTAIHEFFGLGTLEAIRAGLHPVLPNDLAYPELLPAKYRESSFLYDRETDLADVLEGAIHRVRHDDWAAQRDALSAHSESYRWTQLAPRYDALFESLHESRP